MMAEEVLFWWTVLAVVNFVAWVFADFCLPLVCVLLITCLFEPYQYLQSASHLDIPSYAAGVRASLLKPYQAPFITIVVVTFPCLFTCDVSRLNVQRCLVLIPLAIASIMALARIKALLKESSNADHKCLEENAENNKALVGDGLALGYYVLYLKNLFSECDGLDFVKRLKSFEQRHRLKLASYRVYILAFSSCTNNHSAYDVLDKVGEPLRMQYTRGGVTRTINNTVYRGRIHQYSPDEDEFYVICETLSPISTIHNMDCVGFTKKDKLRTLRRVLQKLEEFLREDPSVREYVTVMEIDDVNDRRPLNHLLWEEIKSEKMDTYDGGIVPLRSLEKAHLL